MLERPSILQEFYKLFMELLKLCECGCQTTRLVPVPSAAIFSSTTGSRPNRPWYLPSGTQLSPLGTSDMSCTRGRKSGSNGTPGGEDPGFGQRSGPG